MKLSPHPLGLGGPVGGRYKQEATTINNYGYGDLLSGVATINQPETSAITPG